VVAAAVEPYLTAWRASLSRALRDTATAYAGREAIAVGPPAFLTIVRRAAEAPPLILDRTVLDLVGRLRSEAERIRMLEPAAVGVLAERLAIDLPTLQAELRACDFTPQLATGWISSP
jgi:hypothetical protein